MNELALTNIGFNFLKGSKEFLNLVLDNIDTCVLLLDHDMKLVAFNDSLKTIFSNKQNEDLLYVRCGEALGCAYQVEEHKQCGTTSKCEFCELRVAAITSYARGVPIYQEKVSRPYITLSNDKVTKHLNFSTRLFTFEEEKYIVMIVRDVTEFVEMEEKLERLEKERAAL